jgi:hypothetical protein
MIVQLLTQLQAAETVGIAVVKAAEAAYVAAKKNSAAPEYIAGLDPGRHQLALGAVRTAIAHVGTLVNTSQGSTESHPTGTGTTS